MNITYEYSLAFIKIHVNSKMLLMYYKKIKYSKLNSSEYFINQYNSILPLKNVGSTILHLHLLHSCLNCIGDTV